MDKTDKKLAVVFPGIGYHRDKPLLYYAAKLALVKEYEIINVEYHDMPQKIKGDADMMRKAAEIAYAQADEKLRSVAFSACSDVLFIGKSIGTVAMAQYATEHKIDAKHVWYTPIEATFSFGVKNAVAFIGDADPWSDVGVIKRKAAAMGIKLYSYPDCNHSLECENVDRNIANLREVMRITADLIDGQTDGAGTKKEKQMSKTILCYGDSNTYGFMPGTGARYPKNVRYSGRLQMLLGDYYTVIEEGCNGRTTLHDDPVDGWKNGMDYLRPCLASHKPVDVVILMLGSNDLKDTFHLTAMEIAEDAGRLVEVIKEFTVLKQGFAPKIILVSPPEIGKGIAASPFAGAFSEASIAESRKFPACYRVVAEKLGCIFFNAAEYVYPSDVDSLHLTEEGHKTMAEKLAELIKKI